jgi:hypothetical protein
MRVRQAHLPSGARKDHGPGAPDQASADNGDLAFNACHFFL